MQGTIFVTPEAFETANAIKDLDYYQRSDLCEATPGFAERDGFRLKNAQKLKLSVLPESAHVAVSLTTGGGGPVEVSLPSNLRGCIFEKAPDLPAGYADIVSYWSGETINANTSGAIYFQCPANSYMVHIEDAASYTPVINDRLLSEGIVVAITGLADVISSLSPQDFIEVILPLDDAMMTVDFDPFWTTLAYNTQSEKCQRFFLMVADVLASPDTDRVFIDLLQHDLIDYGFWY